MTKTAQWVALGTLFLIPFIPLYVSGDLFFPYITGKGFAFRILVEVALAAWIILALSNKDYRAQFSWPLVFFKVFVLWILIADLFAVNPHKALWSNFERMDGWVTLIHLYIFGVVVGSLFVLKDYWKRWWLTFLGASALVTGYGLLQIMNVLKTHQGDRIDASFGNAAYLPGYLLFAIAIAIWQAVEHKGWLRYALFALAALETLVLFFSATRGAFLGLIGALIVGALLWLIEGKGVGRKFAVGTLLAVVLLVGGLFLAKDTSFVTESQTLSRLASAFNVESLNVRFKLWNIALQGVMERPITGWGQEGFNYVFAPNYDTSLYEQEPWFDRAHNVFLDWLVAGGIPALLLFLAFLLSIVVALYRGNFSRIEKVTLIGALVAYSIQGLAVFDNLFTYIPLVAIAMYVHGRVARPFIFKPNIPVLPEHTVRSVITPVVILVMLVVIWFVNIPNIQAAGDIIKGLSSPNKEESLKAFERAFSRNTFGEQEVAERMVGSLGTVLQDQMASDQVKRAFVQLTLTEMNEEVERVPRDPRLWLQFATGYTIIGDYDSALRATDSAIALSPNKQTSWLQKGGVLIQKGDMKGARDAFYKAYELDPSFKALAPYAAAGDIFAGEAEQGRALLMEVFGTTTVDSEPLRLAYYQTKQYDDLVLIEELRVRNADNSVQSRFALVSLLAGLGRYDAALSEIQAIVRAHPETAAQGAALMGQIEAVR
jgi:O-antigen ligase/tetratricopeptide (TPR) repeat protein